MTVSKFRNPSYITSNRLGIYQLQYRVPRRFLISDTVPKLVRKSLSTRDRNTALILARRWVVVLDDLAIAFEDRKLDYAAALQSLIKHSAAFPVGFEQLKDITTPVVQSSVQIPTDTTPSISLTIALDRYLSERHGTLNRLWQTNAI